MLEEKGTNFSGSRITIEDGSLTMSQAEKINRIKPAATEK